MTPAIDLAKKKKVAHTIHQYQHDPANTNFGLEAAEALGQDPKTVFKTLLFALNGDPKKTGGGDCASGRFAGSESGGKSGGW